MRYLTFSRPGDATHRLGTLRDGRVLDLSTLPAGPNGQLPPASLLDLVHQGPAGWRQANQLIESAASSHAKSYRTDEVRWHAPIPRPAKNVFCVGRNFLTH